MNSRITKSAMLTVGLPVAAGLLLLAGGSRASAAAALIAPTWEYFVLGDIKNMFGETLGTSSSKLNEYGSAGWEAVAVYPNGATLLKRRKN